MIVYMFITECIPFLLQQQNNQSIVFITYKKQILITQKMNYNDGSDESDNEGFVANQIRIHSHQIHQDLEKKCYKPFQAKYLHQYGIIKKQPQEAHLRVSNIPTKITYKPQAFHYERQIKKKNMPSASQYYNAQQYEMVYSRFKKPLKSQFRSAFQNQVDLRCLHINGEERLKKLRQFNQKSLNQTNQNYKELVFDSQIQSGNLLFVFKNKNKNNTYDLLMQNDTNTYGYSQWFYFAVKNTKVNQRYTFRIANFKKSYSFFKLGQEPLLFSLKKAKQTGNGWYRNGENIKYYQSAFIESQNTAYYTLQFSIQFQYQNDYVTLSPYSPYSYTRLIRYLDHFQKIAEENKLYWKVKSLTLSLGQNEIPYITLTKQFKNLKKKKNIVILGRQHSGQSLSSFLAEQMIDELVAQKTKESQWILQNFVVRIIPMINVDGVIYGNFRCDLAGYDINRCWKNPIQALHPQIIEISNELNHLNNGKGIELCLDLHTHSKELGAFAYCCVQNEKCREFPAILSKITSIFRYSACTFGISEQKQATARAKIFGITNNMNTITIQLSSFGFKDRYTKSLVSFTPEIINHISKSIIKGFHCYYNRILPQVQVLSVDNVIYNNEEKRLSKTTDHSQLNYSQMDEDKPIQGSDSEPQIDQIDIEIKIKKIFPEEIIENIIKTNKLAKKVPLKRIKTMKKVKQTQNDSTLQHPDIKQKKIKKKMDSSDLKSNYKNQKINRIDVEQQISKNNYIVKKSKINFYNKIQQHQETLTSKVDSILENNANQIEKGLKEGKLKMIEYSEKKMPSIAPISRKKQQEVQLNYTIKEPESSLAAFTFIKTHNRLDKTYSTYEAMVRPRARLQNKKVCIKEPHILSQQIPFLYILSQTKKQRLKQPCTSKSSNDQSSNTQIDLQKKAILQKFKESQKNPMEILSRVLNKQQRLRYDKQKFFN